MTQSNTQKLLSTLINDFKFNKLRLSVGDFIETESNSELRGIIYDSDKKYLYAMLNDENEVPSWIRYRPVSDEDALSVRAVMKARNHDDKLSRRASVTRLLELASTRNLIVEEWQVDQSKFVMMNPQMLVVAHDKYKRTGDLPK